jgi:DNA-directed RNA polymerase specialized sigma24 family protein
MTGEHAGSVTRFLGGLKTGEPEATRKLWERYFADLVRLARARLRDAPRLVADSKGYADREIAMQLGCCLGTVARRLRTIRTVWTRKG